ncbi:MAG: PAS domain S-box protein, partial [Acetobacteraceae bacterium]|nr:PAS domain S-box protein [Acetobacteraceae bacterium]
GVFGRVMDGERVHEEEAVRLTLDGTRIPVSITATRMVDAEGRVIGVSGIFRDLRARKAAEAALAESEARLQEALAAGQVFAFTWDPVTDRVRRSASSAAILGVTDDAAATGDTGQAFFERLHPEDRARVVGTASDVTPEQPGYTVQYRYRRPDGRAVWLQESASARFDPAGRMIALSGLTRDVSAEVEARAALAESEARFRAVVQDQAEMICRFRADGTILFVNAAYAAAFGRNAESLEGVSFFTLTPATEHAAIRAALAALTPDRPVETIAHRVVMADGTEGWVEWTNRLVLPPGRDGRGAVYQATGRDVTERRRMEAALRERETLLRLSQEAGRIGAFMRDMCAGTVTLSEGYRRLFGLPAGAEVLSEADWAGLVHPEDRARVAKAILETMESGASEFAAEYRIVRPADGAVRDIEARARCERDPTTGVPLRVHGVHLDVTERRVAEQALARSESRYRSFVEASSPIIWTMTPDGQVGDPIPSWQAYTGQSHEAARGLGFLDAIHPEDQPGVMAAWERAVARGDSYQVEYRLRRHDGAWRRMVAR